LTTSPAGGGGVTVGDTVMLSCWTSDDGAQLRSTYVNVADNSANIAYH